MPRVRTRRFFSQISDFERGRIIGLHEGGVSLREIARRLGRAPSTVLRIRTAWRDEGREHRRGGSGRPRVVREREERRLRRLALRDRFRPTTAIAVQWLQEIGSSVSLSTVYRRIQGFGLHSYRPTRCLPLTAAHKRARLEWCRVRRNWTEEWDQIIFSDESRFCLWRNDGRIRVRRFRGERRNLRLAFRRLIGVTPGIMVWGAICIGGRTPLVFINGTLNARRYVEEILQPFLLPLISALPNAIFQQDNARPHVAVHTREFLQRHRVPLLPWPACSPDFNPIEHVWDSIGRRLRSLPHPPRTLGDLRHQLEVAWDAIPQEEIDHLIRSMPRRVEECINNRGDITFY